MRVRVVCVCCARGQCGACVVRVLRAHIYIAVCACVSVCASPRARAWCVCVRPCVCARVRVTRSHEKGERKAPGKRQTGNALRRAQTLSRLSARHRSLSGSGKCQCGAYCVVYFFAYNLQSVWI